MTNWEKVKSKNVYSSPWIEVFHDDVIRPDGEPGIYSVVRTKGGIGVVAIKENKEILLVAQYRYAPAVYSLEIPKGAFNLFNSKENPLDVAKRELEEETGAQAKNWRKLGVVHTLMGSSDDIVHLFLATNISMGESLPEETEDLELLSVPLDNIDEIISEGLMIRNTRAKMTDATSIAAINLALKIGE